MKSGFAISKTRAAAVPHSGDGRMRSEALIKVYRKNHEVSR